MSDDEADLWPVLLSEIVGDTLSDPDVSPALFSVVAALTVAICENPWLEGSNSLEDDPDWREILTPTGTASRSTGLTVRAHVGPG